MDVSDLPVVIACLITSIVTILRYKRPGETVGFIWKEPIYGENLSGYALPQRSHGFQNLRGDRWVVWSFQISHWTGKFLFRSIAEDMLRLCHGKKWKSSLSIKKFDIVKYGFRKMKRPITDTWHKDFTISEKRIGCAVMRVLLRMTGFWIEKTLVKYMALKKWYLRQHLHDARKSLSTAIESMRSDCMQGNYNDPANWKMFCLIAIGGMERFSIWMSESEVWPLSGRLCAAWFLDSCPTW